MIVVDIETSGTDPQEDHILSIGAVDYQTGAEFYGECSLPELLYKKPHPKSLEVNGFKLEDIQPGLKEAPGVLYTNFLLWANSLPKTDGEKVLLAGHNIGSFDLLFLKQLHKDIQHYRFNTFDYYFNFRTVDLHTSAWLVFGKSMKHSDICRALGHEPEPRPHNALEGAKSERRALQALALHTPRMVDDEDKKINHNYYVSIDYGNGIKGCNNCGTHNPNEYIACKNCHAKFLM